MADEERLSLRADADRVTENESLGVLLSDAVRGVEHDYTRVSISRAVILLAVPMMLEMAMESVFAVVDISTTGFRLNNPPGAAARAPIPIGAA